MYRLILILLVPFFSGCISHALKELKDELIVVGKKIGLPPPTFHDHLYKETVKIRQTSEQIRNRQDIIIRYTVLPEHPEAAMALFKKDQAIKNGFVLPLSITADFLLRPFADLPGKIWDDTIGASWDFVSSPKTWGVFATGVGGTGIIGLILAFLTSRSRRKESLENERRVTEKHESEKRELIALQGKAVIEALHKTPPHLEGKAA